MAESRGQPRLAKPLRGSCGVGDRYVAGCMGKPHTVLPLDSSRDAHGSPGRAPAMGNVALVSDRRSGSTASAGGNAPPGDVGSPVDMNSRSGTGVGTMAAAGVDGGGSCAALVVGRTSADSASRAAGRNGFMAASPEGWTPGRGMQGGRRVGWSAE